NTSTPTTTSALTRAKLIEPGSPPCCLPPETIHQTRRFGWPLRLAPDSDICRSSPPTCVQLLGRVHTGTPSRRYRLIAVALRRCGSPICGGPQVVGCRVIFRRGSHRTTAHHSTLVSPESHGEQFSARGRRTSRARAVRFR